MKCLQLFYHPRQPQLKLQIRNHATALINYSNHTAVITRKIMLNHINHINECKYMRSTVLHFHTAQAHKRSTWSQSYFREGKHTLSCAKLFRKCNQINIHGFFSRIGESLHQKRCTTCKIMEVMEFALHLPKSWCRENRNRDGK